MPLGVEITYGSTVGLIVLTIKRVLRFFTNGMLNRHRIIRREGIYAFRELS